jgi:hypothetical protein
MCMKIVVGIDLWWFPYIIQKILFFLDFLRHCFQFCCMYVGRSNSQLKKNLCISGHENVPTHAWLQDWTRTLCLVNFPAPDTLLPNGNRKTTPTRGYLPWEEAGTISPKISTRRANFPGKTFFCCQSRPKVLRNPVPWTLPDGISSVYPSASAPDKPYHPAASIRFVLSCLFRACLVCKRSGGNGIHWQWYKRITRRRFRHRKLQGSRANLSGHCSDLSCVLRGGSSLVVFVLTFKKTWYELFLIGFSYLGHRARSTYICSGGRMWYLCSYIGTDPPSPWGPRTVSTIHSTEAP